MISSRIVGNSNFEFALTFLIGRHAVEDVNAEVSRRVAIILNGPEEEMMNCVLKLY